MPIEASDIDDFESNVLEIIKDFLETCELEVDIERQSFSNEFELTVRLCDRVGYRNVTLFEGGCSIPLDLVNGTDND